LCLSHLNDYQANLVKHNSSKEILIFFQLKILLRLYPVFGLKRVYKVYGLCGKSTHTINIWVKKYLVQ